MVEYVRLWLIQIIMVDDNHHGLCLKRVELIQIIMVDYDSHGGLCLKRVEHG
jgi:hypothetical protein